LLLAGADRNPKDREGLTPIAHAITKKLDTITAILVKNKEFEKIVFDFGIIYE